MNSDSLIGQRLKHYQVLGKLGEGGMGVVYRAEDTTLGREVAIKVLPESEARNQERLTRLGREARLLARLNHPNIVTLHAVEQGDDGTFLVMELVDGKTLQEFLQPRALDLKEFFDLAIPIAEAVASAHEVGISHRDIKPSNIIVTRQGWPKVLDFGLGKELPSEEDFGAEQSTQILADQLTTEGSVVGTVPYMAPEQLMGKPGGTTSDVFSLGVLFYQMLTGKHPFRSGSSTAEVVSAILRDQPKSLQSFDLDVPNHLGRILRRCLEKEPERRYQQAIELRNELADLRAEVSSGSWNSLRMPGLKAEEGSDASGSGAWPSSSGRGASAGIEPSGPAMGSLRQRFGSSTSRGLLALMALAIVAVISIMAFGGRSGWSRDSADDRLVASFERELPADAVTLAVLPLENLGDDDGTFARALTSEISGALTAMNGMNVVAQGAVQNLVGESPAALARALGVNHLLTGSITWEDAGAQNADGDSKPVRRARFNLRLVHVGSELQVWSDSWTRDISSVLEAQADIAQRVASGLGEVLLGIDPEDSEVEPGEDERASVQATTALEARALEPPATAPTEIATAGQEPEPSAAPAGAPGAVEQAPAATESIDESPAAGLRQIKLLLDSEVPLAMVTVFSGEHEVFRQRFRFRGRKSRSVEDAFAITDSSLPLRVYVVPRGEAARYAGFDLEDDSQTLILEVDAEAQLRARLVSD
jgi:serine/threonine protein kinase/TolB-like protein